MTSGLATWDSIRTNVYTISIYPVSTHSLRIFMSVCPQPTGLI